MTFCELNTETLLHMTIAHAPLDLHAWLVVQDGMHMLHMTRSGPFSLEKWSTVPVIQLTSVSASINLYYASRFVHSLIGNMHDDKKATLLLISPTSVKQTFLNVKTHSFVVIALLDFSDHLFNGIIITTFRY